MTDAIHIWLNVACFLVIAGAATYCTLLPYMTRDD